MTIHKGTSNIHGSYVRNDGSVYKYYGKFTSDWPAYWEAHIWRDTDVPLDVYKNSLAKLFEELVNIEYDSHILLEVVRNRIEQGIEELAAI
ncbi:MAG: hypothetical protein ACLPIG_04915 [Methylocella sp.]